MSRQRRFLASLVCVATSAVAQGSLPTAPKSPLLLQAAPVSQGAQQGSAGKVTSLTLAQAEALALRNNPRITVSHLLSLAQQQQVRQSRSGLLPHLNGEITAEDANDGSRLAYGGLGSTRLLEHVGGGADVSQLITDFGRTRNLVNASKLQLSAQQAREQASRQDVVLVVDQAFFASLQAQAIAKVAQQTVATRKATEMQIEQLTKNNLRSTLDASFAEVDLSQAQLLVLDAQNNADSAMAALNEVLGMEHAGNYNLVAPVTAPAPPPPDIDVLTQLALSQRPDLQALGHVRDAERKLAHAQSEQRLPTVSALGTVGGSPIRSGRYFPSSWDGAVAGNVRVPIFNGFLYSSEAKQTSLHAQATDAAATELRNRIVRDVRVAWLAANNSFARISVTDQLLRQANLSLQLARSRYKLGLSSIVELSQAQLQQTQAEIAHTSAVYSYRATLSRLRFQVGDQH